MKLLTVAEMQERLSKMTYKLGWKMRIYEGHTEGPMFEVIALVDDSVNKGQDVTLEIYSVIPPQVSILSFDIWVLKRLMRIEEHECCEFLQIDGLPIFDPHKNGADKNLLFC